VADNSPRLGKGLGAFFGTAAPAPASANDAPAAPALSLADAIAPSHTLTVPVDAIDANPRQPRQTWNNQADAALDSLTESVKSHGIIQPLIVVLRPGSPDSGPRYLLIAGERRWKAAKTAGLRTVPVVVKNATPQQMLEMALIENIQREDLNPIEMARAFQMLLEEYGLTHEEIGRRVGKDRSTITNAVNLLRLPQEVQDKLLQGLDAFTAGHAKALIGIPNPDQQIALMNLIISQDMTVRQAEDAARGYKDSALRLVSDRRGSKHQTPDDHALEEEFLRAVSLRVALKRNAKGAGTLTITFSNEEELNTLYEMLVLRGQSEEF
jgi:ParB family transcriptional regulator, chromosome partitioning protein